MPQIKLEVYPQGLYKKHLNWIVERLRDDESINNDIVFSNILLDDDGDDSDETDVCCLDIEIKYKDPFDLAKKISLLSNDFNDYAANEHGEGMSAFNIRRLSK